MKADVGTVQEIVALARRAGFIPEDWVDDERAPDSIVPLEFADAEEATDWVETIVDGFRLVRQDGQDVFAEVWCEAAGISGRLAAVADPFGVPVYAGGGFDGLKSKRAAAERVALRKVSTIALHVGDYDTHGRRIFTALAEDVAAWVPQYLPEDGPWSDASSWRYTSEPERVVLHADDTVVLEVRRLGVTEAQVAAGMVEIDDDGKAEAEQLPADWLILVDELDRFLLPVRRAQVKGREAPERESLRELLAARWS